MTARPMTETPPTVAQRSVPQAEQFVGERPVFTDDEREEAIRRAGRAMESWFNRYEASGKKERVPAEACPDIEALTGIACELLRPDVNWSVLRARKSRGAR